MGAEVWAGGAGLGVVIKPGEPGIWGCAVAARLALSEGHGGPRALGAGATGHQMAESQGWSIWSLKGQLEGGGFWGSRRK